MNIQEENSARYFRVQSEREQTLAMHEGSAQKTVKPHLPYNQNKLPATDTIVLTVQDQLAMGV